MASEIKHQLVERWLIFKLIVEDLDIDVSSFEGQKKREKKKLKLYLFYFQFSLAQPKKSKWVHLVVS